MFRMKSAASILVICLATLAVGIGTYAVEQMILEREQKIAALKAKIKEEQDRITVLEADWSYLTRPSRIQRLSEEMLSFAPIETQRILTLDMLDNTNPASDTGPGSDQNSLYRITVIEEIE